MLKESLKHADWSLEDKKLYEAEVSSLKIKNHEYLWLMC